MKNKKTISKVKNNILIKSTNSKIIRNWFWRLLIPIITGIMVLVIYQSYFSKELKVNEQTNKPRSSVGGLVGHAGEGTKITNSSFEGKIIINGDTSNVSVGGIVGSADSNVIIDSSKSKADIIFNPKK